MAAFLCDGMAGHLARWLRLMGHDAIYAGSLLADEDILREIGRRPRVLVTRDVRLHAQALRCGYASVLVAEAALEEELAQTIREAGETVQASRWFSRCTVCNGLLHDVEPSDVADVVPASVLHVQTTFSRCVECRKVFWPGSHVEPIRATLESVARRLAGS